MGPLNNILNRIDANNDQTARPIKNAVFSRATNLFVTFPTEVAAIAQNILLTPFHAAGAVLKTGVKVVSLATGSQAVKNFEAKLPGFTDLLRTVTRIVAYTIGAGLTLTLGVLSPKANFNAHCALGLAINQRREAVLAALADVLTDDIEKEEDVLDAQVDAQDTEDDSDVTIEDDLFAKEQEALDNLAAVFKLAEQIETNVEESTDAAITAIKHAVEETADAVKSSVAATIAAVEEKIEECSIEENNDETILDEVALEEEIDLDGEIEEEEDFIYEYEGEFADTVAGQALASATNTAKDLASNTYSVITNPVDSAKSAYNYVASFFTKQAA